MKIPEYDYLIVGAGLFGSVFAYLVAQRGKTCLVVDKRNHIGGNVYTQETEGIQVHQYGAHIFHTSDKEVWDFMNLFAKFNHYINSPIVYSRGNLYNLPFNMNTYYQLWGTITPAEARQKIEEQRKPYLHIHPGNLEEQALQLVGEDIYEILIKEYTEKQWGKKTTDLPPEIIKRLPIRFTFDNNYFNDPYQGIPMGGYTPIIQQLLNKSDVFLNTDFIKYRDELSSKAKKIIYTGRIDEYYDHCYGKLDYRSLRFEHETLEIKNYQGNAVVNYADGNIPYTRIIEHKHFEFGNQPSTIITREYPVVFSGRNEPFYPVNDEKNTCLYAKYKGLVELEKSVVFAGRLGDYSYYNMDKIVRNAIEISRSDSYNY